MGVLGPSVLSTTAPSLLPALSELGRLSIAGAAMFVLLFICASVLYDASWLYSHEPWYVAQ